MELTGKAKEEFLNFYWNNYIGKTRFFNQKEETEDFYKSLYPILQNTLIVEWFETQNAITIDKDTVNTRMIVTDWNNSEEVQHIIDCTYEELTKTGFTNWWKQAIIKANQIYNVKTS